RRDEGVLSWCGCCGLANGGRASVIADFAAQALDLAAQYFALHPPALRGAGGPRGTARFHRPRGQPQHLGQPLERLGAVPFLAARALRLDHDDAVAGHAAVWQRAQRFLDVRRQTGGAHIEAQVDGAGYLVDVLAAGALRADHAELDIAFVQVQVILNVVHGRPSVYASLPAAATGAMPLKWRFGQGRPRTACMA